MRINLVSLEDGITATGFRKIAAYVERLNRDTHVYYVGTKRYRSLSNSLFRRMGGGEFRDEDVESIARTLANADLVAFSSMTGYAEITKRVIRRVRQINSKAFLIWGGIHAIIHPEDAIAADVDAICTGEGESAFEAFFNAFSRGDDCTRTGNFWFKRPNGEIIRNGFLPLMRPEELRTLPLPKYGGVEWLHARGEGFVRVTLDDYLANNGLAYPAIWSIGCPLHCTYCGNTVFISNDANYKKLRHSGVDYIIAEVKRARSIHPHLATVLFYDDSFLGIPLRELEKFATRWRDEIGLPFCIYGVIPSYVQRDKVAVLTWAGMNASEWAFRAGARAF